MNTNDQCPNTPQLQDEEADVWLDSSVNDYIHRPLDIDVNFENMSVWEYTSKYELLPMRAKNFMDEIDVHDIDHQKFRFNREHPGYEFSCLSQKKKECIPKLHYSNKFPDIYELEMENGNNVVDFVKELRESYAIKAMLIFFPFREKEDLLQGHECMWDSFLEQKGRLKSFLTEGDDRCNTVPLLYHHSLQILQNIQDLINIKKIPIGEERLKSCTYSVSKLTNMTTIIVKMKKTTLPYKMMIVKILNLKSNSYHIISIFYQKKIPFSTTVSPKVWQPVVV
jgi:hypothetical protein